MYLVFIYIYCYLYLLKNMGNVWIVFVVLFWMFYLKWNFVLGEYMYKWWYFNNVFVILFYLIKYVYVIFKYRLDGIIKCDGYIWNCV